MFAVLGSREATGASDILGDQSAGIVTCDRARTDLSRPRLPWCWAHLQREIQKLVDSSDRRARNDSAGTSGRKSATSLHTGAGSARRRARDARSCGG
ncbi:MAG: transposase [Pirellulales bacterium]|nr:transposase [Pirellulales bacterium]